MAGCGYPGTLQNYRSSAAVAENTHYKPHAVPDLCGRVLIAYADWAGSTNIWWLADLLTPGEFLDKSIGMSWFTLSKLVDK